MPWEERDTLVNPTTSCSRQRHCESQWAFRSCTTFINKILHVKNIGLKQTFRNVFLKEKMKTIKHVWTFIQKFLKTMMDIFIPLLLKTQRTLTIKISKKALVFHQKRKHAFIMLKFRFTLSSAFQWKIWPSNESLHKTTTRWSIQSLKMKKKS